MKSGFALVAIGITAAVISLADLFMLQAVNSSRPISRISSHLSQEALNLSNANLTDEQLIRKGFDMKEVKLLYTKYPDDVTVAVDRMYLTGSPYHEIWVTYRVQKSITDANGTTGFSELDLTVYLVSGTNETRGVGATCQTPTPREISPIPSVTIENKMCFK